MNKTEESLISDPSAAKSKEYVCKIGVRKKKSDFSNYKFYNKKKGFCLLKFLHRIVSNCFLRLYLVLFHRVKVVGKHNVSGLKNKGVVVVSNHIHPLDIQMISTFVFGMRSVHWLTLSKNFDLNVQFFIRNSGGVPLPDSPDIKKRCLGEMNDLLQEGGVLHICPEGSLESMCGEIRPFKDGAFRFAAMNKVPLLPVTLRFNLENKKGKKYKYPKFIIDVAEPIYPVVPQSEIKQKTLLLMQKRCNKTVKSY